MMILVNLILMALGIYALSSIVSLALTKNYRTSIRIGSILSAIASSMLIIVALTSWASRESALIRVVPIPLHIDTISSIMLLVVSIPSLASAIFSYSYMEIYEETKRAGMFITLLNMFVASMVFVVLSWDILTFLFSWEVMTLASYLLIAWDYEKPEVRAAGIRYAIAMHLLSSIPLILAIMLTYGYTHVLGFTQVKSSIHSIPTLIYIAIVILIAIAFATKAGLIPLHFWLPEAHPVAPSNISALLSGVMIKMGVYGLLRLLYYVYSAPTWLWCIILAQALSSAIWGSLCAIRERNAKKILAYSSISHVGYMTTAISSGIILLQNGNPLGLPVLAAGVIYVFAHSLFKSLLFLITGCYLYFVNSVDVDKIYGTALNSKSLLFAALIGLLSISGLPPTLGYLSKVYVYGTLMLPNNLFFYIASALLMAASPLSMMYVAKVIGPSMHLGKRYKSSRIELPKSMRISLLLLSSLLLALGFVNVFNYVYGSLPARAYEHLYVSIPPMIYAIPLVIGGSMLFAYLASLASSKRDVFVTGTPWTTGYTVAIDRHRVSASRMYVDVEQGVKPLMDFAHEVYRCLVLRLPRALLTSGISSSITSRFNSLGSWIQRKLLSVSNAYESKKEFHVDEAAMSFIIGGIKTFRSMLRTLVVSPIGLFTIVIVLLALLIIVMFIVGGIAW